MSATASRLRQAIRRLRESLAEPIDQILGEQGPLRRGSFVTLRRKCGKPTCHCATGEAHPANYLSTREAGGTRLVYLSAEVRHRVAEEAERYRRFRKHRARLARLLRTLLRRIDKLEEALESRKRIQPSATDRRRRPGGGD